MGVASAPVLRPGRLAAAGPAGAPRRRLLAPVASACAPLLPQSRARCARPRGPRSSARTNLARGGRGIRTHDDVAAIAVFKTAALGHYASPPWPADIRRRREPGADAYRHVVDAYQREGESPRRERLDRNWDELLQELRVSQTGVQILTGFLLTLPIQPDLPRVQRLRARRLRRRHQREHHGHLPAHPPVAMHRWLFRQRRKGTLVRRPPPRHHGARRPRRCGRQRHGVHLRPRPGPAGRHGRGHPRSRPVPRRLGGLPPGPETSPDPPERPLSRALVQCRTTQ